MISPSFNRALDPQRKLGRYQIESRAPLIQLRNAQFANCLSLHLVLNDSSPATASPASRLRRCAVQCPSKY